MCSTPARGAAPAACRPPLRAYVFALQSGVVARLQPAYAREPVQGRLYKLDPALLGRAVRTRRQSGGGPMQAQFLELIRPGQEVA
jgi:hypothetical protein